MIPATYTDPIYNPDTAKTAEVTGPASGQGQDAFLKMFMAQMTHQDPLDPMDNTEFTAQLAQFSSLEQLTKIAQSMEGIERLEQSMQETQLLSYIGKEVTISGNQISVSDGVAGGVRFNLAGNAGVRAVITSVDGKIVADEDLGWLSAGSHDFRWNGQDLTGHSVPDGTYSVSFVATDAQGKAVKVGDMQISGLVTGYTKDTSGKFYLLLGDTPVPLSKVLSVKLAQQGQSGDDNSGDDGFADDSGI